MLTKDQNKVLQTLLQAVHAKRTISDLSRSLKQKYFQTYRTVKGLEIQGLVRLVNIGKSSMVELDFNAYHPEYVLAEIGQCMQTCKNKDLIIIRDNILRIEGQFICVLFGSHAAKKSKPGSDIDIIFIIPKERDYGMFEKLARRQLSVYGCDINITTEQGLLEMWSTPGQLNVGNELLENHVVLLGAEQFIRLMRKHHVG